jgi:ABC-type dipeptide/oligopeptide/nickel transport system permease component
VILKHAFKNALLPVITMMAINFVVILTGAIVTEVVFAWPGIGRLLVDAIFARDYPVVQTVVFMSSLMFIGANLLVDIAYSYIDPRVRYNE